MGPEILVLSLAMMGAGLILGAFILGSYNTGWCPANPTPPLFGHSLCDHAMTIDGITFWISATAEGILAAGAALLVSSVAVALCMRKAVRNRSASSLGIGQATSLRRRINSIE
jgi:hypothetical protein